MAAYYNEFDPQAAAWLRELIKGGHIADGEIDVRSIVDVRPDDLREFTQCHFFAGIGVWSYALRNAGWPDDKPIWTGSCPCQPFSAAGAGKGFDDERHLWPDFHWLIRQCQPSIIIGEQVASKAVEPWVDLVHADLEALGYSFGCVPFPSAGVGAPHIRDRAYWVADTNLTGLQRGEWSGATREKGQSGRHIAECLHSDGVADPAGDRWIRSGASAEAEKGLRPRSDERGQLPDRLEGCGISDEQQASLLGVEGLADTSSIGCIEGRTGDTTQKCNGAARNGGIAAGLPPAGPANGFWRDADWLYCRDDKWRPVEPGTFPLVDGAAARMGRLRGYGNAINAEAAKVFISTYLDCRS